MSEAFIGEIRMFASTFAPVNWAFCDGQLLNISGNETLFALLGTFYGGDGRTTFGLPDLRGRVAMHNGSGTGPGLSTSSLGQTGGQESVTLIESQLPSHSHSIPAGNVAIYNDVGDQDKADANTKSLALPGANVRGGLQPAGGSFSTSDADATIENAVQISSATGRAGGGLSVNNMQPYLFVNYMICLQGIFPQRN